MRVSGQLRGWLAAAAVAASCAASRAEEPVFPYRTASLYAVPTGSVSHAQVAVWPVPLAKPAGLALTPDGRGVVVGLRQGVVLSADGVLLARFSWTNAPMATAVAVAPDGRVFVAALDRVIAFGPVGTGPSRTWDTLGDNVQIVGMAADTNQLWLCDAGQRVVWRFDHEGRLLGQLPPPGAPREQRFIVPSPSFSAAVAPNGDFWVVNPGRHQLQRHAPDGRLLASWSRPDMNAPGFCGCCNPAFIAVLPDGALVTSEKHIPRIKIYRADGAWQSVVVPPLALPGETGRPIATDRAGRVLVLDGERIRIFERQGPAAAGGR